MSLGLSLFDELEELRDELRRLKPRFKELRLRCVTESPDSIEHLALAKRHLEDATMRLGCALYPETNP